MVGRERFGWVGKRGWKGPGNVTFYDVMSERSTPGVKERGTEPNMREASKKISRNLHTGAKWSYNYT